MIVNGPGISFTEPDIGAEFVPPIPEHPREKIVALCEHCTNRLLGRKELKPFEYWSFAAVTTDEMADVLLKMKMRKPYTLPMLLKETGLPEDELAKLLDEMSYIGLIEYNWENPERDKQWVLPMLVPGSAEFLNMRMSQLEEHPVLAKFFEQASKGALEPRLWCRRAAQASACTSSRLSRPSPWRTAPFQSSTSSTGSTSTTASTPPARAAAA